MSTRQSLTAVMTDKRQIKMRNSRKSDAVLKIYWRPFSAEMDNTPITIPCPFHRLYYYLGNNSAAGTARSMASLREHTDHGHN